MSCKYSWCSALTEVNISNSVTSIEDYAFHFCERLPSVIIPSSVTNMGISVFGGCFALTSIIVDSENPVYDSRDNCNAIIKTANNELIAGCTNTTIPNSVTSIGDNSFEDCENLTSIAIPNSVTSIGNQAFHGCYDLSTVTSYIEEPFKLTGTAFPFSRSTLYVPYGTKALYEATEGWNQFQNIVEREKEPSSVPYIVWCKDNSTLYFLSSNTELKKGGTYDGQIITDVWSGEDVTNTEQNEIVGQFTPPRFTWTTGECTRFVFDKSFETVRVRSTSAWFNSKLESIEGLEYLNTSEVTSMSYMFGSLKLSRLDLSHFDTHKVKYMHCMFEHCSGLTDLDLSHFDTRNVQTMANMFSNCPNLKSIDLSSFDTGNVVNMSGMFRESTALTTLDLTSFNTSNVTAMRQMCYGCTNLTSIDMSSFDTGKVTDMWLMFGQCVALKTIYAGDGWSTVNVTDGSGTFAGCTKLVGGRGTAFDDNQVDYTYARIDGGTSHPGYLTDINGLADDNIIFADANVKAICVENWDTNGDGELSESEAAAVTDLGDAFREKSDITSFEELQYFTGLTEIGDYAFYDCRSLRSVKMPQGIIRIGDAAFFGDQVLGDIELPKNLTSIAHAAFGICSSLKNLIIPRSVTSIVGTAFRDCIGLETIVVDEENAVFDSRNNCNAIIETSTRTLVAGCKSTTVPDGVEIIGRSAFYGQHSITTLNLPASVKEIGDNAYDGCGFETLEIPNTVTTIGFWAFQNCGQLKNILIPASVTSIVGNPFCSTPVISVVVDDSNPVYDSRNNCNGIIETASNKLVAGYSVTEIPDGVQTIGDGAFDACGSLVELKIPKSVTCIESAFWACSNLASVYSDITVPFEIPGVFSDEICSQSTLYVPAGTKALYEATEGWNQFANIVEMEPADIDPLEKGEEVDFGENSELTEETDLGGVIADNMYFNIPNDKGRYEPVEGCIVITSSTSDEDMAAIEGKEFFDKDLMDHFAGFIFKVPAGQGNIRITAEATGDMTLRVKIGDDDPIEKQLDGRRKVSIPYNVSVETLVYVYAGQNASVKGVGPVTASSGELKIYSIEREDLPTDIANVGIGSSDVTIYSLSGQRLAKPQKGVNVISITRPDGTVQTLKMRR